MTQTSSVPRRQAPSRYTPGRLTMALLIAGRAAFRGLWLAAPLLLAGTWSADDLGATVAAIGGFGWLSVWLGASEKTLLKQVPRLPRLANQTVRTALGTLLLPLGLSLTLALVLTAAAPDLAIWGWGLAWAVTGGLLLCVAAVHRLDQRAWADMLIFAGGAAWLLAVTLATILADWPPLTWLITCLTGVLAIATVALIACRDRWRPGPHRTAAVGPLRRSLLLLSLPEVLSIASVSAGYWAITGFATPAEAGPYYLAVTVAGVFGSFVVYVVRLRQPDVSLALRGPGAAGGERKAARIAERAVIGGVAIGLLAVSAALAGLPWWAVLALLTLGEIVVFGQRSVAANLVENARSRWLPGNVAASASGLIVALVVLALAVPTHGAVAAMGALLAAQICNAAYLRWLLTRSVGRTRPGARTTSNSDAPLPRPPGEMP